MRASRRQARRRPVVQLGGVLDQQGGETRELRDDEVHRYVFAVLVCVHVVAHLLRHRAGVGAQVVGVREEHLGENDGVLLQGGWRIREGGGV